MLHGTFDGHDKLNIILYRVHVDEWIMCEDRKIKAICMRA